jgi:hypothetical protein
MPTVKIIPDAVLIEALKQWGDDVQFGAISRCFPEYPRGDLFGCMGKLAARYASHDPNSSFERTRTDLEARKRFVAAVIENWAQGEPCPPYTYCVD